MYRKRASNSLAAVFILLPVAAIAGGGGAISQKCTTPELEDHCQCSTSSSGVNIDCTGLTSENMLPVLAGIEPTVAELSITDGNIEHLDKLLDCSQKTYDNLNTLILSNNNIASLDAEAFNCMPNLERLLLNKNKIYVETPTQNALYSGNFLKKLTHLKELQMVHAFAEKNRLHHNESHVTHLSSVLDINVDHLEILDISNNTGIIFNTSTICKTAMPRLKKLFMGNIHYTGSTLSYECLEGLEELFLKNNLIMFLDKKDINCLKVIPKVYLAGNPFECNCALQDFYAFLKTANNVADKNQLECGFPFDMRGEQLVKLQKSDLQCNSAVTNKILQPVYAVIAVLIAAMLALLVLCLVLRCKHLKRLTCKDSDEKVSHIHVPYSAVEQA